MKISYNWLKEFVDIAENPQQLSTRLTNVGLAVDALDAIGSDFVYELDVATNRPDCLSHMGVGREVAAIYGSALRPPKFELRESEKRADKIFSVSIADPDLCGRYCARYIEGVKIGPSPHWLKARLESLGVRSINNVADITNYVMLELGQPLHAFDADTLHGRQIIVRRADLDEKMTTLDGVERQLDPSVLLIADKDRAVAIAGVMGGSATEISPATKNVLLESANFNPLSIRKTSRAIGLTTEASYRFERGADIEMARFACDQAAALINELAGGTIYRDVIDVYPGKLKPVTASLRRHRIERFLGAPVDDAIVERIFERLGFKTSRTRDGWSVEVPSHRLDISREEDLLEEIARQHGFDKFPATLPSWSGNGSGLSLEREERLLRDRLAATGYSEVMTMAFSDEATERKFRPEIEPVRLLNPIAEDESILRTSLIPSMLRTIEWNLNRGLRDLQLYEIGKVYRNGSESRSLILAATGNLRTKTVHESERDFNFYDLKGDVEEILRTFDVSLTMDHNGAPSYYHPGRSIRWGDVAVLGELHPELAEFKHQRIYLAELDAEMLLRSGMRHSVEPIPRFPWIRRDLSLLLDKGTRYEDVRAAVAAAGIPNLVRVEPFDRLESGSFPESKYSLAISLIYQSSERTLTDAEVEQFDRRILTLLEQRVGAQLRK
ncbi:MAG TPA: phenylalanine--tRNA ligase subunit beta [Terriglobia bacterium]|nr:phenylalanine--tRNA ligase subunit beta [Terriglobia bacterium]